MNPDTGDSPKGAKVGQNVGYADYFQHKYWHFKGIGFTTDGTPVEDGRARESNPDIWLRESEKLAEEVAYAEPLKRTFR